MFVRTSNNEIIDLSYCRYFEEEHRYWNGANCYSFEECEIIKQADTIEELCDEFVIKPKNDMKNWLAFGVNTKHLKESIYNLNYPIKEVYGAIWTEKGLIYVAKMNNEGELELL